VADCDLCNKPVEPGEPRFGGVGDGGKKGSPLGYERHWACHVERFGRPPSTSITAELGAIGSAFGRTAAKKPPRRPVLRPLVTKGPDNRSPNAAREWRHLGRVISEMGRRRIEIECPFCFEQFWAFVWSLSGGGKRCPNCRAMHTSHGTAHPLEGNEDLAA
jgi:hypothetical protein